jgi:putative PIN family toxin of toxin-antitoxin system
VIDSGIWISALRFGGTPERALIQAATVDQIAISDRIEEEVVRIAERKFRLEPKYVQGQMSEFLSDAIRVTITGAIRGICRDPNDDHLLECAKKSSADLIVSGDWDLRALVLFQHIPIRTAAEYLSGKAETTKK